MYTTQIMSLILSGHATVNPAQHAASHHNRPTTASTTTQYAWEGSFGTGDLLAIVHRVAAEALPRIARASFGFICAMLRGSGPAVFFILLSRLLLIFCYQPYGYKTVKRLRRHFIKEQRSNRAKLNCFCD